MPKLVDLTGKRYGKLVVLERKESVNKRTYWACKCDCGNIVSIRSDTLGRNANSCGCLKKEQDKKNLGRYIHGKSHDRLSNIWYHIKTRCNDEKSDTFQHYGGRGIAVCDTWEKDYLEFEKWALPNGYTKEMTIDRIDVDGDYSPENCRWIPFSQQANNKRNTLWVEYNSQATSLKDAYDQEKPNIGYNTARKRYHRGERELNKLFADRMY